MNSEPRVILVRHGETEANRAGCFAASDEIPLTENGRRQAEEIGIRLAAEFRPRVVLSSEFLRARQTSEIIARVLGLTAATAPGIHERNFGCLKGQPYARMGELMNADSSFDPERPWMWAPEGGESLEEVRRRAVKSLEGLRSRYEREQIVVVSHGAVMQSIRAHINGDWSEEQVPLNCALLVIETRL